MLLNENDTPNPSPSTVPNFFTTYDGSISQIISLTEDDSKENETYRYWSEKSLIIKSNNRLTTKR
jgi:hypothetical protein